MAVPTLLALSSALCAVAVAEFAVAFAWLISVFAAASSAFALSSCLLAFSMAIVLAATSCLAWDNSFLLAARSLSSLSRSSWETALATVIDAPTPQSDLLPEWSTLLSANQ